MKTNIQTPNYTNKYILIEWHSSYEIGEETIDTQHKKLVGIINAVYEFINHVSSEFSLQTLLEDLLDYTKYHFSYEEKLMLEHRYPEYLFHKREHDRLCYHLDNLIQDFDDSSKTFVAELLNFLKNWLIGHILKSDNRLKEMLH